MDLALWRLSSMRGGKPLPSITLDVDGLPIETFGSQTGTAFNRYVGCKHYSPLVASIAETGDLVGGLLREGNVGPALEANTWIPQRVERFRQRSRLFIIRLCRFIRLIRMVDAFRIKKLQISIFNHVCQVLIA